MGTVSRGYRPDIDGLRAVAVLAVVFYHAKTSLFSGGFVGVDVFFVISGYLITSILLRELREGRFSYIDFYFRRVRRIFPALYTMVLVTLVAGFFLTFPRDYFQLARAVKYIAFFSSNRMFWESSGDYWAQNLQSSQPLLHTWSVAVEEQFYVVVPALLAAIFWLAKRFRHAGAKNNQVPSVVMMCLGVLAVFSFAWSEWLLRNDMSAAFYLLLPRAWELFVGGILAAALSKKTFTASKLTANVMSFIGLASILWAVFAFSHGTRFPGASALFPCIGSALIILAGTLETPSTPYVNRLLGTKPFTLVGLMSYSLYLWHWPIFIFARAQHWAFWGIGEIPLALQLAVVAIFTYLSWRFVEEPFRHWKTTRPKQIRTLAVAVTAMLLISVLGTQAIKTTYTEANFRQPVPAALAAMMPDKFPYEKWQASLDVKQIAKDGGGMALGGSEAPPEFAVFGDSFGTMWGTALDEWSRAHGMHGLLLSHTGCPPLDQLGSYMRPDCDAATHARYEFLKTTAIKKVILIGAWNNIFIKEKNAFFDPTGAITTSPKNEYGPTSLMDVALDRTLKRLTAEGYQVFVMGLPPGDPGDKSPYGPAIESLKQDGRAITFPMSELGKIPYWPQVDRDLRGLQKKYGFQLLKMTAVLCPEGQCLLAENGQAVNNDAGGHLTTMGSRKAAPIFDSLLPKK